MKKIASIVLSVLLLFPLIHIPESKEKTFGDGYNGASLESSVYTSIPFSTKEDEEISIEGGMPLYYNTSSRTNTCANVAGAILLGYYDKTYDELIENFTAARVIRGKVLYAKQTQAVENVMARLYVTMKTNITEGGTTIRNFKTGQQTYVNEQGRNISYRQVIRDLYVGDHIVVCYGLRTIRYYDASGKMTSELNLLLVATGYEHSPTGYILIDDYGTLVDGYSVEIY